MTGYFSKLADRSGLTERHGGAHVRSVAYTEHGWAHRKTANEVTHDFTEQNKVELTPSDETKTFSNSESMPEISHHPAALNTAEQAGDLTQHKVNESDPGHDQAPITDTERHINRQQTTDLPEAATIHQAHPDEKSSMAGKVFSSTIPITDPGSEQTKAASRTKAISAVTDGAVSKIQRKSIAPAVRQSHTEAHALQTVSGQRELVGGQQAVFQKSREVSFPGSQGPQSEAIERTTLLPRAVNNDGSFVSKQSCEDPLSAAYPLETASTNSMNQGGLTNTNRNESSTGQPVEIRIGTLSFEIRQDPATVYEPPQPNDLIEAQKLHHSANNSRPQTQAYRLSRYYLRGY